MGKYQATWQKQSNPGEKKKSGLHPSLASLMGKDRSGPAQQQDIHDKCYHVHKVRVGRKYFVLIDTSFQTMDLSLLSLFY